MQQSLHTADTAVAGFYQRLIGQGKTVTVVGDVLTQGVDQLDGAAGIITQLVVEKHQLAMALPLGQLQRVGGAGRDGVLPAGIIAAHIDGTTGNGEGNMRALYHQLFTGKTAQTVVQCLGLFLTEVPETQREFGAVHPVYRAGPAHNVDHGLAQGVQHLVSEYIVIDVVDEMKMVDADHQDHCGTPGFAQGLNGTGKLVNVIEIGDGIHRVDNAVIDDGTHKKVRFAIRSALNSTAAGTDHIVTVLVPGTVFQVVALLLSGKNVFDIGVVHGPVFRMDVLLPDDTGVQHILAGETKVVHRVARPAGDVGTHVAQVDVHSLGDVGDGQEGSVVQTGAVQSKLAGGLGCHGGGGGSGDPGGRSTVLGVGQPFVSVHVRVRLVRQGVDIQAGANGPSHRSGNGNRRHGLPGGQGVIKRGDQGLCLPVCGVFQDHNEFVTADPVDLPAFSCQIRDAAGNTGNNIVALGMAIGVVDLLEVIDVDE